MAFVVLALIINTACFSAVYCWMPNISVLLFLVLTILVPLLYNLIFVLIWRRLRMRYKVAFLAVLTTIAYSVFAFFLWKSGKIIDFAISNTVDTEEMVVTINTNIFSVQNLAFVLFVQLGVLYLVGNYIENRFNNNISPV